ncbi:MAG TPA: DUF559 domain-containing protein [Conexibacter sp.]
MGLTPKMIRTRLAASRLLELHRGVSAVGHARLTRQGEWMAGVLAAGPGAVLSHRSAAALHGLLPERGRRVEVTTSDRRVTTNWVEVHRTVVAGDVTVRDRIPVTSVSRTLADLAGVVERRELERAVNEADVLRVLDVAALLTVLDRLRGRRGSGHAALLTVLAQHHGPLVLRSELEREFRSLVHDHALPRAEHNVRIAGWEVDACWRAQRLVVELDSRRFHSTVAARLRDARKDDDLRAAGWGVLRYRWHDVVEDADQVAAELRGELSAGEVVGLAVTDGASRG